MKIQTKLYNQFIVLGFIFLTTFLLATSCDKRPVKLNRSARKAIDSIAAQEIKLLRPELDSICNENFEGMVKNLMDSIRLERLREIKDLIN